MARKRKSPKAQRKKHQPTPVVESPDRRVALRRIGYGALGLAVLGGAGLFSVNAVQATMAEYDLTRIGNGTPAIVQIHDPSCTLCTELQRQTRKALRSFDDSELTYLVANITTDEGAAFANRHGVPHVTLLLFDGAGAVQQVISGVHQKPDLVEAFTAHLGRAPST
ncbi:hypothetical protein [Thalassococcus sp. S3]|uniref:hypothetical protein n=1 Tax=Thalassococcus sp. S3 TaxID=2017482 RepID=UPI00102481E3|nr:hypothetical protein [Thalassococcus sp. S3]QBF32190.1 hypothetical protein CFI11_13315 [Thalassococcus sp. S3]